MKKSATIKDIARLARVSPTAVSMAINNRPGVGEKTRKKILAIADRLDYQPNYIAKSLISKKSYSIGLVVTSIVDPFYPEVALGVEETAISAGYNTFLCHTNHSLETEKKVLDLLKAKQVDGVVLATATLDDANIQPLLEAGFPLVLINRVMTGLPGGTKADCVVLDNFNGSYQVGRHLYKLGHDRIAVVEGDPQSSTALRRSRGISQALQDHGLTPEKTLFVRGNFNRATAYQAAVSLLKQKNPPTAFFSHDDNMALGIREAILESGLRIPEDIGLVGFNNIETASLKGVELTTVSAKQYEMGAKGAQILIDRIEDKIRSEPRKIVLDAELVIRKSCGHEAFGYRRDAATRG